MQGDTREGDEVETFNDYPFDVQTDLVPEPDYLGDVKMSEDQLESAVQDIVPDRATVEASGRHTRTVAEADIHKASGEVHRITVSYDIYADEEHYRPGVGGWAVIVSCLDDLGLLAE